MKRKEIINIIKSEEEYPEPCPRLKATIKVLVHTYYGNELEKQILCLTRQAVKQTKSCILQKVKDLKSN